MVRRPFDGERRTDQSRWRRRRRRQQHRAGRVVQHARVAGAVGGRRVRSAHQEAGQHQLRVEQHDRRAQPAGPGPNRVRGGPRPDSAVALFLRGVHRRRSRPVGRVGERGPLSDPRASPRRQYHDIIIIIISIYTIYPCILDT